MRNKTGRKSIRSCERGQVLVIFVGALIALLGFAAIGIDAGYLYTVRHELQRCTDAGALAGASAFFDGSWNDSPIRALAGTRARSFATLDKVASSTLDPSGISIGFPGPERIRVDASRTVNLFFSRIFLGPTRTVNAYSIAEASVVNQNVRNMRPWGIPFPWDDTNGNGLYDPGETVHRNCPEGTVDTSRFFCPGTRVILKIGTPHNSPQNPDGLPSIQQEPGHFFSLSLDGTGASVYRDTIVSGSQTPVSVGEALTLEPGNMVGPTVQGARDLIDADPNSSWNSEWNRPESGQYRISDDSWMNSPRVVRIPVYDPEDALVNGRSEMIVASFAGFWIESIEHHQGTIIGRFLPMRSSGTAGPGPSAGPVLRVLRLVE